MPRTPKSSSHRWSMPSFFSSGFSSRRTAMITTQKEDSVYDEKEESPGPAKEEAGPWILLHDRNGCQFLWNKKTGHWTYDCIAVFAPPAPALDAMGYYNYYGLHQQRQQQQFSPYVQANVGYYAPGPYAAVHHQPWQQYPDSMGAAVPRMVPAAPGVTPIYF